MEGVKSALLKNNAIQPISTKNANKLQLTVDIPNRLDTPKQVAIKPRINRNGLNLVGKSVENTRPRKFIATNGSDIKWGKLPAGGERYYRPTMNESTMIDSLKDYFTTKLTDIKPESNTSRLSRYQNDLDASVRYKKLRQRGKTDISRNTWSTIQPECMEPSKALIISTLMSG